MSLQNFFKESQKIVKPQLSLRKGNVSIAGWRYPLEDGLQKLSFSLSVGRTDKEGKWYNKSLSLSEKEFKYLRELIFENFKE